jgi:hydrogenase small subunit
LLIDNPLKLLNNVTQVFFSVQFNNLIIVIPKYKGGEKMTEETIPYGRKTQRPSPVSDIHVLWITAGLGCDGDSVSVTAATQPSIEDVLLGAIPGLPTVHLHNPVLAYEVGDEFMKYWYQAEQGMLDPFVMVVEGSIPNENLSGEGYWAALGTDAMTGQPITTNEWIDRLAPKALAVVAIGTCATYGGIHAMEGNPTGCMGLADYLGWDWRSKAGLPIVNVPGCPVQPDNFMETLLYLLYQVAGLPPMPAIQPRFGTLQFTTGPQQPSLTMHFGEL